MRTLLVLPLLALGTAPSALSAAGDGCESSRTRSAHAAAGEKDIVETAVAAGDFETLAKALRAADLVSALQGDGPFTVFAPTDDAFAALSERKLASLLQPENVDLLRSILTFHVVPGRLEAEDVVQRGFLTTLNGQRLDVDVSEDGVRVAGGRVVKTDIGCSNGVIHVIDGVLLPSTRDIVDTALAAEGFATLTTALKAAGLVEALRGEGPFTVFAPTDAAFAKLPEGTVESLLKKENRGKLVSILKYHVVPGRAFASDVVDLERVETLQGDELRIRVADGEVRIGDATVVRTDLQSSNGVIHVIDAVLLPE